MSSPELSSLVPWSQGYVAGYVARCREESESWQEESAHRVYVSGEFVNRPTSAERLAERQATLSEGHAAGLHHLVRPACPLCVLHGSDCRSAQNGRQCSGLAEPCRCPETSGADCPRHGSDAATARMRRRHGAACQCVDCWPDLCRRTAPGEPTDGGCE